MTEPKASVGPAGARTGNSIPRAPHFASLKAQLLEVINTTPDPSPIGVMELRANEGGHDTEHTCLAAEQFTRSLRMSDEELTTFLLWNVQDENSQHTEESRRLGLVFNNILACHYLKIGKVDLAHHAAEAGFSSWHMDIFNHKLIISCKAHLRLLGHTTDELRDYLDGVYCERAFEFVATTGIGKAYLCSTNYLTPPFADFNNSLISIEDDPAAAAAAAWNSKAARYIRRSIVAGDFRYCSALTCPRIIERNLPKRKKDDLALSPGPHLVQRGFRGFNVFYFDSRMYAVPVDQSLNVGEQIKDSVLVSYTVEDLESQIDEITGDRSGHWFDLASAQKEQKSAHANFGDRVEKLSQLGLDWLKNAGQVSGNKPNETQDATKISRSWFDKNGLNQSVVLGLGTDTTQHFIHERMRKSPRELILSHDNSCNISCPTCRSATIIASKEVNAQHDRLIPLMLELIKDADYIVCSGSGDPFASRHFRRLLGAIGGKEQKTFGLVERRDNFRINLMTNGLQFTRQAYRELGLKGLVGDIALSMDACEPASFEAIRRGSKWDDLITVLEFLLTIRHENPFMKPFSYFTVQRDNFRQIPDFIEFCRKYRFDGVQMNMPQNWGSLTPDEFSAINVGDALHPDYAEFLEIMKLEIFNDTYVQLGNAAEYRRMALATN